MTATDPARDPGASAQTLDHAPQATEPLLEVRGLSVQYGSGAGAVRAVDGVDLVIHRGEVIGIAGESGSGKSTLAHAMTRLLRPPAVVTGGQVLYHARRPAGPDSPVDVLAMTKAQLRHFRWEEVAVVFQSAMNALNPVIDVRSQLVDAMRAHQPSMSRQARSARAAELLELVGVSTDRLRSFPHQLSGGMRQRVMIAMALALGPDLVIMDEPTTALDVVTQRQILEKLEDLRVEFGFATVFITHDLSLLLDVADSIAIMYAGRIVEVGPAKRLHAEPAHPYSRGLINSFPPLTGPRRELSGIPGFPPDLRNLPPGCPFAPRCQHAMPACREAYPPFVQVSGPREARHIAACWLHAPQDGPAASGSAADGGDRDE
ncbi:MAG TPA: ABC transporter ATP-binding protein [Streptosporangiaceae bacterium]|jgi:peptide/nickel transport system ATP-binding protein